MKRATCGERNTGFILGYEEPRQGNPFETTVYAWDEGEAKCERPEGHKGPHAFNHRSYTGEYYIQFSNVGEPCTTYVRYAKGA